MTNMIREYRAVLKNLEISQFAQLLQKVRKTAQFVKPNSDKRNALQAIAVSTSKRRRKIDGREYDTMQKGRIHCRPHIAVVKVGPIVSLARLHMVKTEVSYHVLLGRPWLHKHQLVPSTYHKCVKGRLNGRMIRIVANPSPFEQAEAHLVGTMFYDQWTLFGESLGGVWFSNFHNLYLSFHNS